MTRIRSALADRPPDRGREWPHDSGGPADEIPVRRVVASVRRRGDVDGLPRNVDGLPRNVDGLPRNVDGLPRNVDGLRRNVDAWYSNIDAWHINVNCGGGMGEPDRCTQTCATYHDA